MSEKRLELRELVATDIEVRAGEGDSESRIITGVVIKYNQPTNMRWFTEKFAPGAFKKYLADKKNNTRALYHHDDGKQLASTLNKTLKLFDSDTELRFEAEVVKTSYGDDTLELVKSKEVRGMSFGFRVVNEGQKFDRKDDIVERTVFEADLPEITVTGINQYEDSQVSTRSVDQDAIEEAKKLLEDHADQVDGDGCPELRKRQHQFRRMLTNNY